MCIRAQGLNGGSSDPTSPRRKASLFNLPPIERSGVFSFKGLVARGLVAGGLAAGAGGGPCSTIQIDREHPNARQGDCNRRCLSFQQIVIDLYAVTACA